MLLNRTASLTIGEPGKKAVVINDLRFSFNARKDTSKTSNQLTLQIYNMNNETRRLVERVNNSVVLAAGYSHDGGPITIFTGSVLSSNTHKELHDIITELTVSDGILPLRHSKISISYVPDTDAENVLLDLTRAFGLPMRKMPEKIVEKVYPSGFAFSGKTETAMTEVCNYLGLTWSIQDHALHILDKNDPINREMVLLSPESGLIGIPTRIIAATRNQAQGEKSSGTLTIENGQFYQIEGFKVKSLLQPKIYPGCYVALESAALQLDPSTGTNNSIKRSGQRSRQYFRAEVVSHRGDTTQGEWVTECELKSIEENATGGSDGGK